MVIVHPVEMDQINAEIINPAVESSQDVGVILTPGRKKRKR